MRAGSLQNLIADGAKDQQKPEVGMIDAIDFVLALRTGDSFRLRGRVFTIAGYEGWTHGGDARGDYVDARVWNAGNKQTFVRIRPTDKIEACASRDHYHDYSF